MSGKALIILIFAVGCRVACAQSDSVQLSKKQLDSLYIEQVEEKKLPGKILHAEPLYIDLIRDLGARKGEREWNFGMGMTDNFSFDTYSFLVEYEWALFNRLGVEVELPFTFTAPQKGVARDSIPAGRLESLKMAVQWTFLVSEPLNTSLALGYIHELEMNDFENIGRALFKGNVYNPFLVAAKRWGNNFHTLLYTGPRIERAHGDAKLHTRFDINTNLHYMIPGTRNFAGIELNKNVHKHDFDMVIRPQMRIGIADNFLIGIVSGIPVNRENQRLSMFIRLIWEPGHKQGHQ